MQIFSNSNGARGAIGSQRATQMIQPDAARPNPTTVRGGATARRDSVEIGGTESGVDGLDSGSTPQERLEALAQKYLDRLDALMEKEGLSREQVEALQGAKDAFQQNIDRFSSAFLSGDGAHRGMGGAFGNIVGELRGAVQAALEPSGGGGDEVTRPWQR